MSIERHAARLAAAFALLCSAAAPAAAQGLEGIAVPATGGPEVMTYMLERRANARPIDTESAARVYGGKPAAKGDWPFQVALVGELPMAEGQTEPQLGQFCGGSIIARQWILTAAHCLVQPDGSVIDPDKVFVETGAVKLGNGELRQVSKVIAHEGYDSLVFDNDIALLKLAQPITDSEGPVGAVKVLPQGAPPPEGAGTVIGWGLVEGDKFTPDLMETQIDVLPNDTCNRGMAEQTKRDLGGFLVGMGKINRVPEDKLVEAFNIIVSNLGPSLTNNMICAGVASGERTSCHGDSGGPLLMRTQQGGWIQVGIVSWGKKPLMYDKACGHEELYGVYTRASNYFNWIGSNLRNN